MEFSDKAEGAFKDREIQLPLAIRKGIRSYIIDLVLECKLT